MRLLLDTDAFLWAITADARLASAAPSEFIPGELERNGIALLAITGRHVLRLESLPLHHRDPFDRLLAAQAMEERIPILTADPLIGAYDVAVVW